MVIKVEVMHRIGTNQSFVQVQVTVLVRPGPPVIAPRTPVATEGEAMNISCSSEGGSPAPDIFWYMEVGQTKLNHQLTLHSSGCSG